MYMIGLVITLILSFSDAFITPGSQNSIHFIRNSNFLSEIDRGYLSEYSNSRPHTNNYSNVQQQYIYQRSYVGIPMKTKKSTSLNLIPIPQIHDESYYTILHQQTTLNEELAIWIIAFSSSHIGMSAIRDKLIDTCGIIAYEANLVDRNLMTLPSWWPGDDVGQNQIFPDQDTAGRQIYRLVYTLISFFTLGGALSTYLTIQQQDHQQLLQIEPLSSVVGAGNSNFDGIHINVLFQKLNEMNIPYTDEMNIRYLIIAAMSFAASIASLFNASPLSLMPGFQKVNSNESNFDGTTTNNSIGGLQRNDSLKFEPKGLTRITRHPLILPVVPWGIATSFLAGGEISDFILFSGLSIYAVAGCACQDLRIKRKEGSIGTVFQPLSSQEVGNKLNDFFSSTSFVPFGAVWDGRQSIYLVMKEFPYVPFVLGLPIGTYIEINLLQWIG